MITSVKFATEKPVPGADGLVTVGRVVSTNNVELFHVTFPFPWKGRTARLRNGLYSLSVRCLERHWREAAKGIEDLLSL